MGWNLPPGCTDADIDRACPGYDAHEQWVPCERCQGEGSWEEPVPHSKWDLNPPYSVVVDCPQCGGSGWRMA